MHRSTVALSLVTALAACASNWPTLTATTPNPVGATVDCVAQQAKAKGYTVRVLDRHRGVEATREDTTSRLYVQELNRNDVLTLETSADKGGTAIKLRAGSVGYYETRRGRTASDEPASAAVRADADSILAACTKQ